MKFIPFLAALFLAACAAPTQEFSAADYSSSYTLGVQGMSCPNCANNITHELQGLPGVQVVRIDMGRGSVSVYSNSLLPPPQVLADAVKSAGFTPVIEG